VKFSFGVVFFCSIVALRTLLLYFRDRKLNKCASFSHFFRQSFHLPAKKLNLAALAKLIFHIRSNAGIMAGNRDSVNQPEKASCALLPEF